MGAALKTVICDRAREHDHHHGPSPVNTHLRRPTALPMNPDVAQGILVRLAAIPRTGHKARSYAITSTRVSRRSLLMRGRRLSDGRCLDGISGVHGQLPAACSPRIRF